MERPQYWFAAKRYGWGWGRPLRWQGWVVLAAYLILIVVGLVVFGPMRRSLACVTYMTLLSLLLVGVCWRTGEPPRWRWG